MVQSIRIGVRFTQEFATDLIYRFQVISITSCSYIWGSLRRI